MGKNKKNKNKKQNKQEIKEKVEEFQKILQKKYRRESDKEIIKKETNKFKQALIARDQKDEARPIEEIRKEEKFLISSNMILSLGFLFLFIAWALTQSDSLEKTSEKISSFFVQNFSWFYILASSGFLIYLIYMAFSRFGNVVLGDPKDKPEFSNFSWYSMLFAAGMGVGILFWGAGEPLTHYLKPPVGNPKSVEAARMAMVYSAFHWGLHAWGIYTVCAVGVAYYGFRKRKKYLISSSVMDIFESPTINKVLKIVSDLIATLAIVFGVAASLGMGVIQIATGIQEVYKINAVNPKGFMIITGIITFFFIASATTGLEKGIKILSNLNMITAISLMLFLLFASKTLFILKVFVDTIGQYLGEIFYLSFKIAPFKPGYEKWMGSWTLTYFTWWIAWAPFVGIFIARISKGRTIRELIAGALLIPTIFSLFWFSVFGGSALYLEIFTNNGIGELILKGTDQSVALSLFALLGKFPMAKITSTIAILLLFVFLITSADSATFVISMMTTEGDLEPKLYTKVLWGVILAILTILLVTGGGIKALQAAALSFAFPFCIILILIVISVTIRLSIQVESKRI